MPSTSSPLPPPLLRGIFVRGISFFFSCFSFVTISYFQTKSIDRQDFLHVRVYCACVPNAKILFKSACVFHVLNIINNYWNYVAIDWHMDILIYNEKKNKNKNHFRTVEQLKHEWIKVYVLRSRQNAPKETLLTTDQQHHFDICNIFVFIILFVSFGFKIFKFIFYFFCFILLLRKWESKTNDIHTEIWSIKVMKIWLNIGLPIHFKEEEEKIIEWEKKSACVCCMNWSKFELVSSCTVKFWCKLMNSVTQCLCWIDTIPNG